MRSSQQKQKQQLPGTSKLFSSADEAVADIKSGSTILSSGFGLNGVAGSLPPSPLVPAPFSQLNDTRLTSRRSG
jgi:hypothetical protein